MVKKKHKKLVIRRFTFIFIILLLVYGITYYSVGLIIHSKPEIVVPNIENKSLIEALDIVSNLGLSLKKIGEVYNKDLPYGTIVSQQPPSGSLVRKGKVVKVIVSLGGEKVFVPNVVGEDRRKAEVILRQYGLFVGSITENYSLRFSRNKVISQSYSEGSIVDKNTPVDLVISLGLPPEDIILMPDFINRNIDEVKKWAEKNKIKVDVKFKTTQNAEYDNIVVEQYPLPDTVIEEEAAIEVVVLKGIKESNTSEYNFEYELPFKGDVIKNLKIVQVSDEGEYVLYEKPTSAKQKINLYVPHRKNSKIRIFVDGILIDER